jgi:hypothetical protein
VARSAGLGCPPGIPGTSTRVDHPLRVANRAAVSPAMPPPMTRVVKRVRHALAHRPTATAVLGGKMALTLHELKM